MSSWSMLWILKQCIEKTLKDGATLQLAKDKLLAMDEAFIRDFAECGGTVFAATVKKAGGLGQFALLTLLLSCHCHSQCVRASRSTCRLLG